MHFWNIIKLLPDCMVQYPRRQSFSRSVILASSSSKRIFPLASVQTSSGAHPASRTMDPGGPFPGAKARPGRDADHSPPYSAEVKNEWELYLLSPKCLHGMYCDSFCSSSSQRSALRNLNLALTCSCCGVFSVH
jgi:hypothetical protein